MKPPYPVLVYENLRNLYNKRLVYVTTRKIVTHMDEGYYRTYRALRALEAQHVVERRSPHSGWRPTHMAAASYGVLLRNYRRSHDYISAQQIGYQLNTNDRIIRGELAKLEAAGIVTRSGSRGGWKPVRTNEPTAIEQILDTLDDLHRKLKTSVPTSLIAAELGVHPSHARRQLSHYAEIGVIHRTGYFSGYIPLSA